jgi:uncharacterized protein YodC (DUF2158 family)
MAGKFKIGDIVQLKSGGPKMTIDSADAMSPNVYAAWLWARSVSTPVFMWTALSWQKTTRLNPRRNESPRSHRSKRDAPMMPSRFPPP